MEQSCARAGRRVHLPHPAHPVHLSAAFSCAARPDEVDARALGVADGGGGGCLLDTAGRSWPAEGRRVRGAGDFPAAALPRGGDDRRVSAASVFHSPAAVPVPDGDVRVGAGDEPVLAEIGIQHLSILDQTAASPSSIFMLATAGHDLSGGAQLRRASMPARTPAPQEVGLFCCSRPASAARIDSDQIALRAWLLPCR